MKIDRGSKIIEETEKWITYHWYDPIYDNKGYFTGYFETDSPTIITLVKGPPEWNINNIK